MGDEIGDDALLAAIRKRLLDEISGGRRSDAERVVNNVYGSMPAGGITERLYQGDLASGGDDDPYQYMVDIDRQDTLDEEGKKTGWKKRVHPYRMPREGMDQDSKKKKKTR